MPPLHHPGPPHHAQHRHHDVLYNLEERASGAQYAQLLARFAEQVAAESSVTLKSDLTVELAGELDLTVRYERTPHGSLALRVCVEWHDRSSDGGADGSLAELLR